MSEEATLFEARYDGKVLMTRTNGGPWTSEACPSRSPKGNRCIERAGHCGNVHASPRHQDEWVEDLPGQRTNEAISKSPIELAEWWLDQAEEEEALTVYKWPEAKAALARLLMADRAKSEGLKAALEAVTHCGRCVPCQANARAALASVSEGA